MRSQSCPKETSAVPSKSEKRIVHSSRKTMMEERPRTFAGVRGFFMSDLGVIMISVEIKTVRVFGKSLPDHDPALFSRGLKIKNPESKTDPGMSLFILEIF